MSTSSTRGIHRVLLPRTPPCPQRRGGEQLRPNHLNEVTETTDRPTPTKMAAVKGGQGVTDRRPILLLTDSLSSARPSPGASLTWTRGGSAVPVAAAALSLNERSAAACCCREAARVLGGCRVGAGLIAAGAGFQTAEAESRTSRPSRGLKWEEDLIDARPPCARETVGTTSQRSRPRTVSMNNRRDDWDQPHRHVCCRHWPLRVRTRGVR